METFAKWLDDNRYTAAAFARDLSAHMKLEKPLAYQTILHWRAGDHKPKIDAAFAIEELTNGGVPIDAWR